VRPQILMRITLVVSSTVSKRGSEWSTADIKGAFTNHRDQPGSNLKGWLLAASTERTDVLGVGASAVQPLAKFQGFAKRAAG
jgi:hypothetical protein